MEGWSLVLKIIISFVNIIHTFVKIRIFKLSEFPCKITHDEVSLISYRYYFIKNYFSLGYIYIYIPVNSNFASRDIILTLFLSFQFVGIWEKFV